MTSKSKYVTEETLLEIEQRLEGLKEEEKELDLLELAGNDVSEQRRGISEARKKAIQFLNVYKRS